MLSGDSLAKILEVLRDIDGYVVVRDGGDEFVVSKQGKVPTDKQLALPTTKSLAKVVEEKAAREGETPDFILEGINREIAAVRDEEQEQEIDDLSLQAAKTEPGKKVRFEPITGDLPPELQE